MRLERLDSYLTRFEAVVVAAEPEADGTWVRLDRSAFYPTAGGQPHDTGTLDGRRVVDVVDRDGAVWHLLEPGPAPAAGSYVVGEVDWERRFAHMQRHTAQHMLSQAFVRVGAARGASADGEAGFHTRSVSMRSPDCTLDLTGEPDAGALAEAEAEVDRAARRALPVLTFEVPDDRLAAYRLRRPPKVSGMVRLVAVGDYDLVACGGTHVRDSAQVLPVKVLGLERVRGGLTRVTFRAGAEALEDHALKHRVAQELSPLLSAPPAELAPRVRALSDRVAGLEQELKRAQGRVADGLAASLLRDADRPLPGDARLVVHALAPGDDGLLDPLVDRLQGEPGCVALLALAGPGAVRLAFLAGPGAGVDVRPALRAALDVLGGRGGGRPDRAQGAGQDPSKLAEALGAAVAALRG